MIRRLLDWAFKQDTEMVEAPDELFVAGGRETGGGDVYALGVAESFLRVERECQSGGEPSSENKGKKGGWSGCFLRAALVVSLTAVTPMMVSNEDNLYRILQVQAGSSLSDITKSYRQLSRKLHPDKVR